MGRTSRWLKNLLRGKKNAGNGGGKSPNQKLEKRRWSFARLGRECSNGSPPRDSVTAVMEKPPMRIPYYQHTTTDVEKNKHAIAVAAATAAAADAAVVAAHAAVAVVNLTRQHGRGSTVYGSSCSGISTNERWAAVKIQTSFRGFLARKAHRALRALVKLQALVRGYLVRKQAAATLYSMQALIRAQATARSQRCSSNLLHVKDSSRFYPEIRHRRSLETRSEYVASFHSRRLSATLDPSYGGFDDSPKIVEIDPGRPKSRNTRLNPTTGSDSTNTDDSHSSPLQQQCHFPTHISARLTIPDSTSVSASDWHFTGDECRFSTAQSTPRFLNSIGQCTGNRTPARSVCYEGSGGYSNNRRHSNLSSNHYIHPNYMAKTESFNAKVRSQSAPKQRPEPRKRLSLKEMVGSRSSLSGVGMMRSCSKAQEAIQFKNAIIVDRIDRSEEHDLDDHHQCFQRRW